MEICRRKNQIEISELDPFLAELLRQIPASANTEGAPAAEQRIFSLPINGKETELCAEWKMYVEPELRRLFQTATQTVGADLEQLIAYVAAGRAVLGTVPTVTTIVAERFFDEGGGMQLIDRKSVV